MDQIRLADLRKPVMPHLGLVPGNYSIRSPARTVVRHGTGVALQSSEIGHAAIAESVVAQLMRERAHVERRRPVFHGSLVARLLAALAGLALLAAMSLPAVARTSAPAAGPEEGMLAEALGGQCVPPAAHDVLRAFKVSILNAPTTEEARALVLAQTGLARQALSAASFVLPFSDTVRDVDAKFAAFEVQLYAANTQTEVASDFAGFLEGPATAESFDRAMAEEANVTPMQLADADLDNSAVSFGDGNGGGGGCNYTTGEIIIIVLGFLLFIIPGIIFLIILC